MAKKVVNKKSKNTLFSWTELWAGILWIVVLETLRFMSVDLVRSGVLVNDWHVELLVLGWFVFGALTYGIAVHLDKKRKEISK